MGDKFNLILSNTHVAAPSAEMGMGKQGGVEGEERWGSKGVLRGKGEDSYGWCNRVVFLIMQHLLHITPTQINDFNPSSYWKVYITALKPTPVSLISNK